MTSTKTPAYKDLPQILRTKDSLYALFVHVASLFRNKLYESRLAEKGVTYMDLANELFLKYLEGKLEATRRVPMVNGKKTKPSVQLSMPIAKGTAYYIVKRDLINMVRAATREERADVKLISMEEDNDRTE